MRRWQVWFFGRTGQALFWIAVVFACALAPDGRSAPSAEVPALRIAQTGAVICDVFGARYCGEALEVAWCESRFSTTARNGQYLGLFQMGSSERHRYGHGRTVRAQAVAAHRYFVASGKDWSPWECKP